MILVARLRLGSKEKHEIENEIIEKYNIKEGTISPFTRLKVIDLDKKDGSDIKEVYKVGGSDLKEIKSHSESDIKEIETDLESDIKEIETDLESDIKEI